MVAVHDEAGGFFGAFGIDDAAEFDALFARVAGLGLRRFLVGDDADGGAGDASVAADEGAAVVGAVLVELAAVYDAGDEFVRVVGVDGGFGGVGIKERIKVFGRVFRGVFFSVEFGVAEGGLLALAYFRDERAQAGDAEVVVRFLEVDGAGDFGVHGCAA